MTKSEVKDLLASKFPSHLVKEIMAMYDDMDPSQIDYLVRVLQMSAAEMKTEKKTIQKKVTTQTKSLNKRLIKLKRLQHQLRKTAK